jgi:hypothetical protein
MDRRHFLQTASIAVGGGVLAACGGGGDGTASLPDADAEQTLFVQAASFEFLTGRERWVAFGVADATNTPLPADATVEVFLRTIPTAPDEEAEVVAGPLTATFSPASETGQGVYYTRVDLERTGFVEIVAVSGDDFGTGAVQIVDPVDSQVIDPETGTALVPGAMAVAAPTATEDEDRDVFSICTQDPVCGMHEMSLDEALETGRPVVLLFATPQFCATVVCGPSVANLDRVRTGGDWGETIFIHSEIFAEEPTGSEVAGTPLVDAVQQWGLPTEPWLFTIGGDGVIRDRLDGPMPDPILQAMVEELTA